MYYIQWFLPSEIVLWSRRRRFFLHRRGRSGSVYSPPEQVPTDKDRLDRVTLHYYSPSVLLPLLCWWGHRSWLNAQPLSPHRLSPRPSFGCSVGTHWPARQGGREDKRRWITLIQTTALLLVFLAKAATLPLSLSAPAHASSYGGVA